MAADYQRDATARPSTVGDLSKEAIFDRSGINAPDDPVANPIVDYVTNEELEEALEGIGGGGGENGEFTVEVDAGDPGYVFGVIENTLATEIWGVTPAGSMSIAPHPDWTDEAIGVYQLDLDGGNNYQSFAVKANGEVIVTTSGANRQAFTASTGEGVTFFSVNQVGTVWVSTGDEENILSVNNSGVDCYRDMSFTDLVSGDVNVVINSTGVILTAPDGGQWRLVVDNTGTLSTEAVV